MFIKSRRLLQVFPVTFIIGHVVIKEVAVTCISCYIYNWSCCYKGGGCFMCPVTFIIDHVFIKEEAVTCNSCYIYNWSSCYKGGGGYTCFLLNSNNWSCCYKGGGCFMCFLLQFRLIMLLLWRRLLHVFLSQI